MATEYPTTAKIIDTLIDLDTIMPTLLNILAKQGPDQRNTLNAALTYALYRLNSESLKANMKGVADILNAWKDQITPAPAAGNGKAQGQHPAQNVAADIDTLISQLE